jgi:outer membrane lipoprotein carrier protein
MTTQSEIRMTKIESDPNSEFRKRKVRALLPRGLRVSYPALNLPLALLLVCTSFVSNVSAQPTNQTTAALLDQIARKMGQTETVFTRFEQARQLSLFQEPLRSEGYLSFQKPGRIRWEITQPYQSILVSDGRGVAQFERVNDQWKRLELGLADAVQNVVSQIGAVMEGRYTGKQRDYAVSATHSADGAVVTLTPQHPAMRKMMQAIEIHLGADFQSTRRIVLREVGGDFTDIRFSEQIAGASLPPGTFDRVKPVGLEQIRQAVQRPRKATIEKSRPE